MNKLQFLILLCALGLMISCSNNYESTSYSDSEYAGGAQVIPGKVQCEYYDLGGEGVAYHDTDSTNSGSGGLNKGEGYLNNFRISEAVDISYTKFHDFIDNSPYNFVETVADQLYIGWTEPGEWTKYTVNVEKAGTYQVGIMYTANANGQIALSVNDLNLTGPLDILSTYAEADTLNWRQWHHWNYLDAIAEITLEKGLQTLTLHTVSNGQMNYDFLVFNIKNSKE
jgi:hypothetical protein